MIYGAERLIQDLRGLGYEDPEIVADANGMQYGVIKEFEIPAGNFQGRKIDLAIPAPSDYPRVLGASIHIKAEPHIVPFGHIANLRNVINSPLGLEWQYWSYQFHRRPERENQTLELISQINGIFKKN